MARLAPLEFALAVALGINAAFSKEAMEELRDRLEGWERVALSPDKAAILRRVGMMG